jgi:hypothetical protein
MTQERMQADALARLKVEEIRSASDNLPSLFTNDSSTVTIPAQGRTTFEQNSRYAWQAQLTLAGTAPQTVEIAVDVLRANDTVSTTGISKARGMVLVQSPTAPARNL